MIAASLRKIASDPDGIKFLTELDRNNPGILDTLGANDDLLRDVAAEKLKAYQLDNFRVDRNFMMRHSKMLEHIKSHMDARVHDAIASMEFTVMTAGAVRVVLPDHADRLAAAANYNIAHLNPTTLQATDVHDVAGVVHQEAIRVESTAVNVDHEKVQHCISQVQDVSSRLRARETTCYQSDSTSQDLKTIIKVKARGNKRTTEDVLSVCNKQVVNSQEIILFNLTQCIKEADSTPSKKYKLNAAKNSYNKDVSMGSTAGYIATYTICNNTGYCSLDDEVD